MHRRETYPFREGETKPIAPPASRTALPRTEKRATQFRRGIRHLTLVEEPPTVAEVMSPNPYCATLDTHLDEVARVLIEQAISGVPVVDAEHRPVGMVTKTDILRVLRAVHRPVNGRAAPRHNAASRRTPEAELPVTELADQNVRGMIVPIVFSLPESATITQAAALMSFESEDRIPIVDKSGRMSGIVSSLDILRWMARREGYLIP
jgi:CBS domain-containing protein